MNVTIEYLYRDAGNWKQHGRVVVANPDGIDVAVAEKRLKAACGYEASFVASDVNFPSLFFDDGFTADDVDWHELVQVHESELLATDSRTLNQVVTTFETQSSARSWKQGFGAQS